MREPISTISTEVSLNLSMASVPNAIFIHPLTTTFRTLYQLFIAHLSHLPALKMDQIREKRLKKGDLPGGIHNFSANRLPRHSAFAST
jgi:hypothetical protein